MGTASRVSATCTAPPVGFPGNTMRSATTPHSRTKTMGDARSSPIGTARPPGRTSPKPGLSKGRRTPRTRSPRSFMTSTDVARPKSLLRCKSITLLAGYLNGHAAGCRALPGNLKIEPDLGEFAAWLRKLHVKDRDWSAFAWHRIVKYLSEPYENEAAAFETFFRFYDRWAAESGVPQEAATRLPPSKLK